jgi:sucrose phosphorylase
MRATRETGLEEWRARALSHLSAVYGDRAAAQTLERLEGIISRYRGRIEPRRPADLTPADSLLITYPDQVRRTGQAPLKTLADFCRQRVAGLINGLHLLPFYPSSSDDGYAVEDYRVVDPAFGDWGDVEILGRDFRLMFDAVINHASAHGAWFQGFLQRDPRYLDFFLRVENAPDLSAVVRPRASPLLTSWQTAVGPVRVWTTFGDDQPDLNFANPDVLLEMTDVLLEYCRRGADFLRLDAVGYLWKERGTACIHLPQTHHLIQLFRTILDEVAPHVSLVTETNVPHADNISYFGDGRDEAQLVYNFALPPLVLHAMLRGDGGWLSDWAASLVVPGPRASFLNFLASHDGIGLNPARGLIPEEEIDFLLRTVEARGGRVSLRSMPGGSSVAYELNINYLDALSPPGGPAMEEGAVDRFLVAHAILFALQGVPGIYFHSLFGSRGWPEGAALTGRSRTVNREKLACDRLEAELNDPRSRRARVYHGLSRLLRARAGTEAFAPGASQEVLRCGEGVFGLARKAVEGGGWVMAVHNLTDRPRPAGLAGAETGDGEAARWVNLLTGEQGEPAYWRGSDLRPYEVRWLGPAADPAHDPARPGEERG